MEWRDQVAVVTGGARGLAEQRRGSWHNEAPQFGSCVGVDRPCGHDVGGPPNAANDTAVPIPTEAIYRAQHLNLF